MGKEKLGKGKFCGNCKHWTFKFSADKKWCDCLSINANSERIIVFLHNKKLIEHGANGNHAETYFDEMALACGWWVSTDSEAQ